MRGKQEWRALGSGCKPGKEWRKPKVPKPKLWPQPSALLLSLPLPQNPAPSSEPTSWRCPSYQKSPVSPLKSPLQATCPVTLGKSRSLQASVGLFFAARAHCRVDDQRLRSTCCAPGSSPALYLNSTTTSHQPCKWHTVSCYPSSPGRRGPTS